MLSTLTQNELQIVDLQLQARIMRQAVLGCVPCSPHTSHDSQPLWGITCNSALPPTLGAHDVGSKEMSRLMNFLVIPDQVANQMICPRARSCLPSSSHPDHDIAGPCNVNAFLCNLKFQGKHLYGGRFPHSLLVPCAHIRCSPSAPGSASRTDRRNCRELPRASRTAGAEPPRTGGVHEARRCRLRNRNRQPTAVRGGGAAQLR